MSQTRRPAATRRSWLFIAGAEREKLLQASGSGADALVQELEDFTAPARRPEARALAQEVLGAWKAAGIVACVRVNPLDGDGMDDLTAIMRAAPDAVLLPKVSGPEQMAALDRAVTDLEREYGLPAGSTELVPNIEGARGLIQTYAILTASPRITASLVASEDMAEDLGVERSREGSELAYVRQRFLVECRAAGVVAIDCPFTFSDETGLVEDCRWARRMGFPAKSAVNPAHVATINRVFTPQPEELERARRTVEGFEAMQREGRTHFELDGVLVERPIYNAARRLLERAKLLGVSG